MKKISTSYILGLLVKIFFGSLLLIFVALQIFDAGYRTFEEKQGDFIEFLAYVIWTFILMLGATTVFLNKLQVVRSNPILRFSSFFVVPLVLSTLVWYQSQNASDLDRMFIVTGIFFLVEIFFYISFLRRVKLGSQAQGLA